MFSFVPMFKRKMGGSEMWEARLSPLTEDVYLRELGRGRPVFWNPPPCVWSPVDS